MEETAPTAIHSERAPRPVGPYSQAVVHGGLAWLSGQVALHPETGRVAGDTVEEQTERVLQNLSAVLEAAGSSWDRVLRVTVYLADIGEFGRFNAVYERMLGGARPARSTVQAGALPLGLRVEIDAVAAVG
jgi:2-iminobutanoate/2-iminopropanoate deaminase